MTDVTCIGLPFLKPAAQRSLLLALVVAFAAPLHADPPSSVPLPKAADVLKAMETANDHFMAEWPVAGSSDELPHKHPTNLWTRAVYFEGALALYHTNKDPRVLKYMTDWGTFHQWTLKKGDTGRSADDQCAAQDYIELYQLAPSQGERLTHVRANLDNWTQNPRVDYYSWIDALQMSMPSFARMGVIDHKPAYFDKMYQLYHYAKTTLGLYNESDGLWWRDIHFKPPYQTPNGKNCYWSRGNGWVLAALARVMDVLPPSDPHYAEYESNFKKMASSLLLLQRKDGFWNVDLGDPNDFGGPEATGTSLFLYGFAWGVRKGILPRDQYVPAIARGWDALAHQSLHPDGVLGYVQGTGSKPSDGQPVTHDSIPDYDDYGLGAFLLAGSQVYALVHSSPTNQP